MEDWFCGLVCVCVIILCFVPPGKRATKWLLLFIATQYLCKLSNNKYIFSTTIGLSVANYDHLLLLHDLIIECFALLADISTGSASLLLLSYYLCNTIDCGLIRIKFSGLMDFEPIWKWLDFDYQPPTGSNKFCTATHIGAGNFVKDRLRCPARELLSHCWR